MNKYNPTSAMEADESYNTDGRNISFEVSEALQPIIDKYTAQNISMRDISHIVIQYITHAENTMILQLKRQAATRKPIPTFKEVQNFLTSWGLHFCTDDGVSTKIPYPTIYDRMLNNAVEVGGQILHSFIVDITERKGNSVSLVCRYWHSIEADWEIYRVEKAHLAR